MVRLKTMKRRTLVAPGASDFYGDSDGSPEGPSPSSPDGSIPSVSTFVAAPNTPFSGSQERLMRTALR
jgi:hypothetical protein